MKFPGIFARKSATPTRVRTPTVLQMEAVECGAAALAIVLAYYRLFVPLEELRVACGVSRDGSKASNVVKAARTYGLVAKGKRLELEGLKQVQLPCIVFWNFNHFLVLEGFGNGQVFINDPANGPRTITAAEFDAAYTGVTLEFQLGPDFVEGGHPPSLVRSLLPRLAGARSTLVLVILASLALVIPGLVIPVFTQVFVDNVLMERMDSWIKPLLLGMGLTALLRIGLTWLQQSQLLRLKLKLAVSSSSVFFWHVLRLPLEFFNQRYASDISQRVSSNDQVAQLLSGGLATNAVNVISLFLYVFIMLQYDWMLTLVGIGITALNLFVLRFVTRVRTDGNMRLLQDRGKMMAVTMGGIKTIETIKASGAEADFFMRWTGYKAKVNNAEQSLALYTTLLSILPSFLNTLVGIAILGLGGMRVMEGAMTVGMLVAFQSLMSSFTQPVSNLMGLAGSLQDAKGDMARLDDVLKHPRDSQFEPSPPLAKDIDGSLGAKLQGALELRDITFGYSKLEAPLIEHFNLSIRPGQRVALVGGSGSGKSTVARLVLGLHKPWVGQVLLDGVDRNAWQPATIHTSLSSVDQDISMFEGTVRDNLRMWDETVTEFDVVTAARDACIHDAIASRVGGYDSMIEEGGNNFSGGQRQRLEIARALAGNPRILVLDEATSALDALTEQAIDENIRRRGCSCMIVAHRLSTIRDCDEIIVMERGKVVERGTHESLYALGGVYRRLLDVAS